MKFYLFLFGFRSIFVQKDLQPNQCIIGKEKAEIPRVYLQIGIKIIGKMSVPLV